MTSQHRSPLVRARNAVLALVLAVAGVVLGVAPAQGATLTVTSNADSGAGSLRTVLAGAGNGDTITFSGVTAISLDSTIFIPVGVTIDGPGKALLTIQRGTNATFPLLVFRPSSVGRDFTVQDLTFTNGVGAGPAVAVDALGGSAAHLVKLENVAVNNMVNPAGGAVQVEVAENLDVTDVTFSANAVTTLGATSLGGALIATGMLGSIEITSSTFTNNNDTNGLGGGAAISGVNSNTMTITDTTFTSNVANVGGGGLYAQSLSSLVLDGVTFDSNTSVTQGGGGASLGGIGTTTITDSVFQDNLGGGNRGGGINFSGGSTINITDSTFVRNSSNVGGGGIEIFTDIATTITRSIFTDNAASSEGGAGIGIQSITSLEIRDSTFLRNETTSTDGGAGLRIGTLNSDGEATIIGSTFSDNTATGEGTSISIGEVNGLVDLRNSTIDDTGANGTTGLAIGTLDPGSGKPGLIVEFSTIVAPGGIHITDGSSGSGPIVTSSIIVSVTSDPTLDITNPSGGVVWQLSWSILSDGGNPGVNDITGNQLNVADVQLGTLADNGGPTLTRLPAASSPAHNAGNPAVVGAPSTDQRGTGFSRVRGSAIDIGAVEIQDPVVLANSGAEIPWAPIGAAVVLLLAGLGLAAIRVRSSAAR